MSEYRQAILRGGGEDIVFTVREEVGAREESWLTNLKGWFGGVGVSATATQRELGHGLFPSVARRTGRSLTLEGYMHLPDEADRLVADRFLSGLLWDGGYGELEVTTGDLTLTAAVRLDGEISHAYHGTQGIDVQVPLLASDPFLYAPVGVHQVYPAGAGVGLRFPLFSDDRGGVKGVLSFGKPNPNTLGVIENRGNATAYPRIRLVGDFPSGFTVRDSRGRTIEYPSPVWDQAPVEIDSRTGAVYQSGMDQTARCTRRDWFSIPAGGTDAYRVSSIQPGDGHAEIIHRDTYI